MAKNKKNRERDAPEVVEIAEDVVEQVEVNDSVITLDEPIVEEVVAEPEPPKAETLKVEPPKVTLDIGKLGDKMLVLLYDMFKTADIDVELYEYLRQYSSNIVNRISPADILFWKAVLSRLDKK